MEGVDDGDGGAGGDGDGRNFDNVLTEADVADISDDDEGDFEIPEEAVVNR